ncbi:uncharacterized protein LOC121645082 [Melanotaenia boesemani]|uniref:uncharacterized protein LOC121645082 n=1 Tax=Melanotaenia boesemani TaxID=1250792 RepID=UPI001C05B652|nr:uncharacterized protein LOC121645082 [Melanotaenia boesemani]
MTERRRRRRKSPDQEALEHIVQGEDKASLERRFINQYKGTGVFTREHIEPKSFVVEYRGVFSRSEGADDKNNKYVFDFMWNGKQYCIDASKEDGTLGRLVNDDHEHPNCKVKRIMVNGRPHLCLFAVREIFPGEEITYNYGDSSWPWRSVVPCEAQCDPKDNESEPRPEKDVVLDEHVSDSDVSDAPSDDDDDDYVPESRHAAQPCCDDESTYTTSTGSIQMPSAESTETSAARQVSSCTLKNYCYVCKKPQSKIARHLKKHEKEEPDIAQAFLLPKNSKERKRFLEKLRNKGNYEHNQEVMKSKAGTLKVKRRQGASNSSVDTKMYVHCAYCKGLFVRKELWRHSRRCPSKTASGSEASVTNKLLALADITESACSQATSAGVWKVLGKMRQDEIASVVRNDFLILQLAQSLYNKHWSDPTKFEYIRTKVREMGRLLLTLRQKYSIFSFEDAVKPNNFYKVVAAVKTVAGYDEEKHSFSTPSLALKLGHSLKKVGGIILCRAISAQDEASFEAAERFTKLCTKEWTGQVSHTALAASSPSTLSNPSTIPLTEDVQLLHKYLEERSAGAVENLRERQSPQAYSELARVTLAQIILFNRRRAGEVSKMTLESFRKREQAALGGDVAASLAPFEQKLAGHVSWVEIIGKRGRKVAVLLNPEVVNAAVLLLEKRDTCNVHKDNPFLFGRPERPYTSFYRGQDCMRVFAQMCGAKNPENLTSAHLRKHMATLSQILNLKNSDPDQLANFSGHDIRVHRDLCPPEDTTQVAKISTLALEMEKRTLGGFQRKSPDELEVEDELDLEVDEGEQDDGGDEDDGDGQAGGDDTVRDSEGDGEEDGGVDGEDGGGEEWDRVLGLRENQEMKMPEEPSSPSGERKRATSTQNETSSYKEPPQRHVCEEEEEVAPAHSSSNQESTSSLKAPEVKEEEPEPAQVKEEELQPPQIKEEAAETKTEETFGNFNIVSIKKEEEETDGQLLETSEPQRSSHTAVSTSTTLHCLQEAEEYIRLGSDKDVLTWRFADHIRGRGVFAKGPISKGSFILEYRGNLFKKGDSGSFGTTINEHTYVFTHKGDDYCIDASSEDGSPGTLVNYHHQPNTSMTKVEVDGVPHLCLFAVVGINEGDEITRDYGAVGVHSSETVDPTTVQNSGESPAAASQQEFLGDSQVEGTSPACVSSEEGRRRKRNEGTAGMKRRKIDCLTHDDIKVKDSSFERRSDCLGPSSSLGLEHKDFTPVWLVDCLDSEEKRKLLSSAPGDSAPTTALRGTGRGRGSVGCGGRGEQPQHLQPAPAAEDVARVKDLQRQRREATENLLQEMSLEDYRDLTARMLDRQPGLVFDLLAEHQIRRGAPASSEVLAVPWCTCNNCRDMPTDLERKCCGQDPAHCVSLLPHFTQYCLDEGYLRIHRQYREDITGLGSIKEPGDDNREYRHAASRHFILWQHGVLGRGSRRGIPSCCVSRIREKFPDPQGQYTNYIPGI